MEYNRKIVLLITTVIAIAFLSINVMAQGTVDVTESIVGGTWADSTISNARGWNITIQNAVSNATTTNILSVTKESSATAGHILIRNALNTVTIATAKFNDGFGANIAQFPNLVGLAPNNYRFLCWNNGSNYNGRRLTGEALPQDTGEILWVEGANENVDDDGFCIQSITYQIPGAVVNLTNPLNNTLFNSTENKNMSADFLTATNDITAINASRYLYNSSFSLISINFTTQVDNNKSNFTIPNLPDGRYWWMINFGSSDGEITYPDANFTFVIDTTAPVISSLTPTNNTYVYPFNQTHTRFIVNATITETNPSSCWFTSTFNATPTYITCGIAREVNLTNIFGWQNITYYTNDTVNFVTSRYTSIFIPRLSFSSSTIIGNQETFILNTSSLMGKTITQLVLIYNGTSYTASITEDASGNKIGTRSLFVPSFTFNANVNFSWLTINSDTTNSSSNNYTQAVNTIQVGNCTSFSNLLFNLTMYDEETKAQLAYIYNASIEVAVNIYNSDRSSLIINTSFLSMNITAPICISTALTSSSNYSLDLIAKYRADDYSIEYYNIERYILNSTTVAKNISLYDLLLIDATEFKISVISEGFIPVVGAIVFVERQYISEDSFILVEAPKTDSEGKTLAHLVRNDIIYNLKVYKDGILIKELENIRAFCDNIAIEDCFIEINQISGESDIPNYYAGGINFNIPVYDEDDNTVTFSYTSTDGITKEVDLIVMRQDTFGNRTACSNSVSSASGTLICSIDIGDNVEFSIQIFSDGELVYISPLNIDDNSGFGSLGYIAWLIFSLVLILMFAETKNGVLISLIISYAGAVYMGMAEGTIVGRGSAGMWIILVTLLGIWRINRFNQQ